MNARDLKGITATLNALGFSTEDINQIRNQFQKKYHTVKYEYDNIFYDYCQRYFKRGSRIVYPHEAMNIKDM